MRAVRLKRPSPAMVIACISLSIALSGVGYAAVTLPRNSVGTAQLKKNAVVSAKVKDGSLKAGDFAAGQLPAGPQGPTGQQGPPGVNGTNGTNATINGVAAGGDLAGTYPNPTIAGGAVTPDKLGVIPAVRAQSPSESFNNDQILNNGGVPEPLQFDEELYDTAGIHQTGQYNATGSEFTAPRAGLYEVSAGVIFSDPGSNYGTNRQLYLLSDPDTSVGGDERYIAGEIAVPQNPGATVVNVSGVAMLNQGDVVQAWVSHNATTNLVTALSQSGLAGDGRHFLSMTWLGPAS